MTTDTEIKTEPEVDLSLSPKRGRGRPRLAPEDRKKSKPRKYPVRKAVRPPIDTTNKLQCSRCLVHLNKEKYTIKRSGEYFKNCNYCISMLTKYRLARKERLDAE